MVDSLPTSANPAHVGPPAPGSLAARLRGFGPVGILAVLVILLTGSVAVAPVLYLPVGAALVLAWTRLSETPWSAIGYVRPRSWPLTLLAGAVFGAALKVVMKAVVMPLLGADPINPAYHFLAGNTALLPAATVSMFSAGFGEETIFRGFLFERLGRLLGPAAWARAAIVLVTSAGFALAHYHDQGLAGTEQAAVTGLVFGSIAAVTRRLPFVMAAHTAFDLTALAIIYADVEARVAHLIFR